MTLRRSDGSVVSRRAWLAQRGRDAAALGLGGYLLGASTREAQAQTTQYLCPWAEVGYSAGLYYYYCLGCPNRMYWGAMSSPRRITGLGCSSSSCVPRGGGSPPKMAPAMEMAYSSGQVPSVPGKTLPPVPCKTLPAEPVVGQCYAGHPNPWPFESYQFVGTYDDGRPLTDGLKDVPLLGGVSISNYYQFMISQPQSARGTVDGTDVGVQVMRANCRADATQTWGFGHQVSSVNSGWPQGTFTQIFNKTYQFVLNGFTYYVVLAR